MSDDIYDYIYVSQGKTKVDSIDDNEELEYTEDAFNVLGFAPEEKFDCYMLTAGVMTCGGIEFKTKGRDDQAECEDISEASFPGASHPFPSRKSYIIQMISLIIIDTIIV